MSDVVDAVLNGDMCQVCGECIDMDCGYPMVCEGCIEDGECEFFNQRVLSAMEEDDDAV